MPQDFFGLPPLAPLARAASALAADFTCPPLRPSDTAAGFLGDMLSRKTGAVEATFGELAQVGAHIGIAQRGETVIVGNQDGQLVGGVAPNPLARAGGLRQHRLQALCAPSVLAAEQLVAVRVRHGLIKPNRLGFVNPPETGQKWGVS